MSEPDIYCCPNCSAVWEGTGKIAQECRRLNSELDDARMAARMLRATLIKIDEERPRDDLRISAALAELEPFFEWLREV